MIKNKSLFILTFSLLLGITSCSKNDPSENPVSSNQKGALSINLGFQATETRAAASTAIPITTWTNNIKSLNLIFVKEGNIVDNKVITPPNGTDNQIKNILLPGVPVGEYDIYLIGNLAQTTNPFLTGAVAGTSSTPAIVPGMSGPINNFLINLVAGSSIAGQTEVPGSLLYREPSEIFLAKGSAKVEADATVVANLNLTRIVSLLRVRINQNGAYAQNETHVTFTDAATAALRIRRHHTSYNLGESLYGPVSKSLSDVLISNKVFQDANPSPANYNPVNMELTGGVTLWNDYMILPGGSVATSSSKLNIVLTGKASEGYIGLDSNGSTAAPVGAGGAVVHWTGAISEVVAANGILEINITLNSPGIVDPQIPSVVDYGKLQIDVTLADWNLVIGSFEMPL